MGIGFSTLPGEFYNLSAAIMIVLMSWMIIKQAFGAAHGPSSLVVIDRINQWWVTYSDQARSAISVGAALLAIGILTLVTGIVGANRSEASDFIAFVLAGAGASQVLYILSRNRSPDPEE